MSRRRFYAPIDSFSSDKSEITLSIEESRHLRDVLRLRTGDEAFAFDGDGREYRCEVTDPGRRGSDKSILEVLIAVEPLSPESQLELVIGVGLLKGEKFDLVIQKLTELGTTRICPVLTHRSDVRLRGAGEDQRRTQRWQRLALEACKQSGRARVPILEPPAPIESFLAEAITSSTPGLMFVERGGERFRSSKGATASPSRVAALTGPEGGWEESELSLAKEHGWRLITLGGRVLRAETAAITVAALLQYEFGDLN